MSLALAMAFIFSSVLYGVCGSRHSLQFAHRMAVFASKSDWQCWSHFSIGVYGSKTNFSLSYFIYWCYLQTVSEKKLVFAPPITSHRLYYVLRSPDHTGGPGTPFSPVGASGTSISVFYVCSATAESTGMPRPAYTVYILSMI